MAFCLILVMWKRNMKKIFSVLFTQQLSDLGSMGMSKSETNKMPV